MDGTAVSILCYTIEKKNSKSQRKIVVEETAAEEEKIVTWLKKTVGRRTRQRRVD